MTKTPTTSRATTAIALVLASMFAFALLDGTAKILSRTIPIPQIMWVRNIVFCGLALSLLKAQGLTLRALVQSDRPLLQFGRSLLLLIESAVFMVAFRLLPIGDVHAIAAMAPLLVVALSVPVLGERVGFRRWLAVLAGFAGVLLIVRPGFVALTPPVLIALAAAALWATYQVLVRLCARYDRSETTSVWTAMIGFLATSLIGPPLWVWPNGAEWLMLGAAALLGGFAHMALIGAYSLTQPSLLQPYSYTLFVWAVVVGYLFFGDVPDAWTWAGAAIIIASGIYVWHRERVRAG